jgi:hypothetical protein
MKTVVANWMTIGITVAAIVAFLGGALWTAYGNVSSPVSQQVTNGTSAIVNATATQAP